MFRGSIPADLRAVISEQTKFWTTPSEHGLYIGCSGNLTLERILATRGWEMHGNDVLLWTTAIGSYYAGTPIEFSLSERGYEEMPWLENWLAFPDQRLATLLLASGLGIAVGKSNRYYDRLRAGYEKQWPVMHEKTLAKVHALKLKLASFTPEDVYTWIDRVPKDAAMISYPPFVGAAKAFEADFAILERMFDWDKPEFEPLEDERLETVYAKIADRKEWMVGVNRPVEFLEPYLRGKARTTNRGVPVYVYTSGGHSRLIQPRQEVDPPHVRHLGPHDELGDDIKLAVLTEPQFAALRSVYMNHNIRPGSASLALAVTVDGVLVGCLAFSVAPTKAHWETMLPSPHAYLLSDFPVAHSAYPRLSKLIVMCALTHEAKRLVERYGNKRFRSLTTTAYSNNPVSMKYGRGTGLKLVKRKENEALTEGWAHGISATDSYYAQKYELQYGGELGQFSLDECLARWRKKHGKRTEIRSLADVGAGPIGGGLA